MPRKAEEAEQMAEKADARWLHRLSVWGADLAGHDGEL